MNIARADFFTYFFTWDAQQQQVDGGSMQTAHPLLNSGHLGLSSQDKGGQHSHQWLDWHRVFSKNSPDTLWFKIGRKSVLNVTASNWAVNGWRWMVFTDGAPSLLVCCCWSGEWTSTHLYRVKKAFSPLIANSSSVTSSSTFLSVNSKSQTSSTQPEISHKHIMQRDANTWKR